MTPSRLSYRAALMSDAGELIAIHFAAVHSIGTDHYSSAVKLAWSPPPDAARQKWLSDLISQDSVMCMVAILDQETILGFGIVIPSQAQLKALYVHPDYSGSGVGGALLQCVEARCREIGLEMLELKASSNAEAFYRHSGYEAVGPTTQQLTDDVSMAATQMVKHFPPIACSSRQRNAAQ